MKHSIRPLGSHRSCRRGLTLTETVISSLITGLILVSALATVGSVVRSRKAAQQQDLGPLLAEQLLAEILQGYYVEPSGTAVFGAEAGEVTSNRSSFDDVDDYTNWSESPPKARDGSTLAGFSGWTRSVSVVYALPAFPSWTWGIDTGLKRITVTVRSPTGAVTTRTALRARNGDGFFGPSGQSTYVTHTAVDLQVGSLGATTTGAAQLSNQPAAN